MKSQGPNARNAYQPALPIPLHLLLASRPVLLTPVLEVVQRVLEPARPSRWSRSERN